MTRNMISATPSFAPAFAERRHMPVSARLLVSLAETITRFDQQRRSRRALALLDTRLLADIGLSEAQRDTEVSRLFWR